MDKNLRILVVVLSTLIPAIANAEPVEMTPALRKLFKPSGQSICEIGLKASGKLLRFENKTKRTLMELIHLSSTSIRIEDKTPDWKTESAAADRVAEVLQSQPGEISSLPLWAEGIALGTQTVTAKLGKNGETIQISSYHVCVKDASGKLWFFRTVPVDGWKK
ncbi:MAG: hypothetical protein M0D55_16020 [Elusimicrobiota bacterium]|nr:MAG: hypothetical protein M0D55_16020 [Elusimicrobiota bacterium]